MSNWFDDWGWGDSDTYYGGEWDAPDISEYANTLPYVAPEAYESGYDFPASWPVAAPNSPTTANVASNMQAPPVPQPTRPQGTNAAWGGVLGTLGPLAGLLGLLSDKGAGQTQTVKPLPQFTGANANAQGALTNQNAQAQGTTPLQLDQKTLLDAIFTGTGLTPGVNRLVEQAYDPALGNIATQAIRSARKRGFAGGAELLNTGPGGAVAGPALADLQGQMANSKLNLLQSLPGLYNAPIANQGNALTNQATGWQNLLNSYAPYRTATYSQPMGSAIGTGIGNLLAGWNAGYNKVDTANQNATWQEELVKALGGVSGMSGTRT